MTKPCKVLFLIAMIAIAGESMHFTAAQEPPAPKPVPKAAKPAPKQEMLKPEAEMPKPAEMQKPAGMKKPAGEMNEKAKAMATPGYVCGQMLLIEHEDNSNPPQVLYRTYWVDFYDVCDGSYSPDSSGFYDYGGTMATDVFPCSTADGQCLGGALAPQADDQSATAGQSVRAGALASEDELQGAKRPKKLKLNERPKFGPKIPAGLRVWVVRVTLEDGQTFPAKIYTTELRARDGRPIVIAMGFELAEDPGNGRIDFTVPKGNAISTNGNVYNIELGSLTAKVYRGE